MELYIVDAFADRIFEGNQAGVVLLEDSEDFPPAQTMQHIAAELKHSETAFVKLKAENAIELKYYTPSGEVALCGHATISAFTVLRKERHIIEGTYVAKTLAGEFHILVEADCIWMEMPQGKVEKELSMEASLEFYQAYGLDYTDKPHSMAPCIVNAGLSDLLLPVNDKKKLDMAVQNKDRIIALSRKHHVVGVHLFYYNTMSEITAYCRNFAPLYGIEEESATGTSNAALTYYLRISGRINDSSKNIFIQGEAMGKPAMIKSRMSRDQTIYIGGNAVVSVKGTIETGA